MADTYNNKIKVIDPASGQTETLAGTGRPGRDDEPPSFDEPAGITAAGDKLYVADTNNHLIRVVDLTAGNRVSTLPIAGLEPPTPPEKPKARSLFDGAVRRDAKSARVRPVEGQLKLRLTVELPLGYKLNPDAPLVYRVAVKPGSAAQTVVTAEALGQVVRLDRPANPVEVSLPLANPVGKAVLEVGMSYYWCRETPGGLCRAGSVVWTVPVEVAAEAKDDVVELAHEVR